MSSSRLCISMEGSGTSNSRGEAIRDRQISVSAATLQERETPRTLSKDLALKVLEDMWEHLYKDIDRKAIMYGTIKGRLSSNDLN